MKEEEYMSRMAQEAYGNYSLYFELL